MPRKRKPIRNKRRSKHDGANSEMNVEDKNKRSPLNECGRVDDGRRNDPKNTRNYSLINA